MILCSKLVFNNCKLIKQRNICLPSSLSKQLLLCNRRRCLESCRPTYHQWYISITKSLLTSFKGNVSYSKLALAISFWAHFTMSHLHLVLKCILLCSFINKIKIVFAMCSENKNFHIVSQIVFAPWSVFRLSKAVACAARRHQLILTAWPSISSSKELELSGFDGELGTAAAAAFTLSWHRWMKRELSVIWLIGIFDAGIFHLSSPFGTDKN